MKENQTSLANEENNESPEGRDRRAKVQAIKQAVSAGAYRVDARSVADSLLTDLLWQQWESQRGRKA